MPLPLTVSCCSKIQIGYTFLVPAHPGSSGQRAVKRVCVCVVYTDRRGTWVDDVVRHFSRLQCNTHTSHGSDCQWTNQPTTEYVAGQLHTYADNVALPAFPHRSCSALPMQQSVGISWPSGPQQQTCSRDRRTALHKPCCTYCVGSGDYELSAEFVRYVRSYSSPAPQIRFSGFLTLKLCCVYCWNLYTVTT